jgi:hypothetical protein
VALCGLQGEELVGCVKSEGGETGFKIWICVCWIEWVDESGRKREGVDARKDNGQRAMEM